MSDKATIWQRYGAAVLYWVIFAGILGLMVFINERYPKVVEVHFAEWTASTFGWIMRMIGMGAEVSGIRVQNQFCRFTIVGECTAYYPMGIFLAATVAFPVEWRRRLLGVALGISTLVIVNQARLVTLCYIFRKYPDLFDSIHALVWQSMMIFFTVILWILWVATLGQRDAA